MTDPDLSAEKKASLRKWRLALGLYGEKNLSIDLDKLDCQKDQALDYLYNREYQRRGLRQTQPKKRGSLDPSQLTAPDWLHKAQNLFPQSVFEILQKHALERYQLSELLNNPKTLEMLEPDQNLLKALMTFRDRVSPKLADKVREVASQVIDDIIRRLKPQVDKAFRVNGTDSNVPH